MKKFILLAFTAALSLGASAQQSQTLQEGFYRVQNVGTGRYAYVYDTTGKLDYSNTTADMGSVALFTADAHNRFVDPASVCYVKKVAHKHNVLGQNTSLKEIVDHYVQIQDAVDGAYKITPLLNQENNFYLKDGTRSFAYGESYVEGVRTEPLTVQHYWNFVPMQFDGAEYLGVEPAANMQAANKYYKPYVVGFDMTLSEGMVAYTVSEIKSDAVIIAAIEGNVVPANTPVIIECSSADAAQNKVTLSYNEAPATIEGNLLDGNYFCYGEHGETAYKKYTRGTMRVLAVVDGKLQYIAEEAKTAEHHSMLSLYDAENDDWSDVAALNANESYLPVAKGTAENLPVMTAKEYEAWKNNGLSVTFPDIVVNDKLDVQDANLPEGIAAMILQMIPAKYHADVNRNGNVSIADLCKLIDMLVKGQTTLGTQE